MTEQATAGIYQVRRCLREGCGLRYPVLEGQPFSQRCPGCRGSTELVLERSIDSENHPSPPAVKTTAFPSAPLCALLDNIRSAGNVGSMFRTADGAGLQRFYLCGMTATPENPAVAKTSLGAHEHLPWSWHPDGVVAARSLVEEGCRLWALEEAPGATPLWDARLEPDSKPVILVVGNEVCGVDPDILELCERVLVIPMRGVKRSLNAAVAFGIAVYTLYGARD